MATNPRIPENRDERLRPMVVDRVPQRKNIWPMVIAALAVAVILLGIIIAKMPTAPKASPPPTNAEVPAQPVPGALQVQNIQMALSPDGNSGVLQGTITNTSNQVVNGVQLAVDFMGNDGAVAGSQQGPVELLQIQGKGANATVKDQQGVAAAPIRPNDSRPFRMNINRIPQGWNHQQPGVRVLTMTSNPS